MSVRTASILLCRLTSAWLVWVVDEEFPSYVHVYYI